MESCDLVKVLYERKKSSFRGGEMYKNKMLYIFCNLTFIGWSGQFLEQKNGLLYIFCT